MQTVINMGLECPQQIYEEKGFAALTRFTIIVITQSYFVGLKVLYGRTDGDGGRTHYIYIIHTAHWDSAKTAKTQATFAQGPSGVPGNVCVARVRHHLSLALNPAIIIKELCSACTLHNSIGCHPVRYLNSSKPWQVQWKKKTTIERNSSTRKKTEHHIQC